MNAIVPSDKVGYGHGKFIEVFYTNIALWLLNKNASSSSSDKINECAIASKVMYYYYSICMPHNTKLIMS